MPGVSLPAIGWPPTKCAVSGSSSFAQRITLPFVLPASVTTAPGMSAGAISSNSGRVARIGAATMTSRAPRTASAAVRASSSMAPSFFARCTRVARAGSADDAQIFRRPTA